MQAAFAAGAVLIFGGWVDAKKTVGFVDWSLLLLIGSALGLSKGIVNSGLADYVGGAIRDSGISAAGSLFVLYAFTMVGWLRSLSLLLVPSGLLRVAIRELLTTAMVGWRCVVDREVMCPLARVCA